MKNSSVGTMLPSEFWKYIVGKCRTLLDDMDNFVYSADNYEKKISQLDQQFLSFVWAMKFVAYEEEIVDSKKKSKDIEEVLGIDIIDKFVKNKTDIFTNLGPVNSLVINGPSNVLKDEEHNSRWVLSVIKKCIAHGNFSVDFDRGVFIIDNNETGNELNCEVGCYWLAQLGNLITPERCEIINYAHLFLKPFMFYTLEKPLTNEMELEQFLNSDDFVCYFPMLYLEGTNEEKIKAKKELTSFWENTLKSRTILEDLPNLTKKVENGGFRLISFGQQHYKRIISEIRNIKNFYLMPAESQESIIETIMYDIGVVEFTPNQSHNIDFGLELLGNQVGHGHFLGYIEQCVSAGQDIHPSAPRVFADYTYCYGTFKKKMALAYMLGILLFSGNKDEIYDQYVDYDSFDLSGIEAYDFASGKAVQTIIDELQKNISSLEKDGTRSKKLDKKIEAKKTKLSLFQSKLVHDVDGIPKTRPDNKEIFHRLRNAFSHKQLFNLYIRDDETDISDSIDNRHLVAVDEDKFIATFDIDELLNILMSDKFYEALVSSEQAEKKY